MSNIPLPKSYLEKILKPINRLTESCVLKAEKDALYSVCSSIDNTVILYAKAQLPVSISPGVRLNLISIKKFLSGLECLGSDGLFSIVCETNNIQCELFNPESQEKTYFKYHLVDDSIVREAPVNLNKIAALKFDTEFVLTPAKLKQIMSAYAFASDLTKIYFYSKDNNVMAEINDKTLQNVDNITLVASNVISGDPIDEPIPLSLEVFKNLAQCKTNVKVKFNSQYKVFVIQNTEEEGVELKYIISALVK
jgi:hypothetical protein